MNEVVNFKVLKSLRAKFQESVLFPLKENVTRMYTNQRGMELEKPSFGHVGYVFTCGLSCVYIYILYTYLQNSTNISTCIYLL